MKLQVAIIGLGRFGTSLANTLFGMGHDVLVLDNDEKRIQTVASRITYAVRGDATSETVLRGLGLGKYDVAIVAIGSKIEDSVLTTILLKRLGVRYVVARAENELHAVILDKIGADKVVSPEQEMGSRLAHELASARVLDYMMVTQGYGVGKVTVPPHFVGKALSELGLGRGGKWGIAVLLIQREKEVLVAPDRTEVVRRGDVLLLAGQDVKLEELFTEEAKLDRAGM